MKLPKSASANHIPGVAGLRAIAAGSILFYHVWISASVRGYSDIGFGKLGPVLANTRSGVALFFVLSVIYVVNTVRAAAREARSG